MSDQSTTTDSTIASAPAAPQTPDLSAQLTALEQRLAALEPVRQFAESAAAAGFDDLGVLAETFGLAAKGKQERAEAKPPGDSDVATQARKIVQSELAVDRHNDGIDREGTLIESSATTLGSGNAEMTSLYRDLIEAELARKSEFYPQSHPLAGRAKPASEAQVKAAVDAAKARMNAITGARLAGKALSPAPAGVQTPVITPASNGKPVRFQDLTKSEKLAELRRLHPEIGAGQTASSAS